MLLGGGGLDLGLKETSTLFLASFRLRTTSAPPNTEHATCDGQTSLSLIRGQEGIAESEPQTGATPATDLLAESEPVSLGAALGGLGFSSGNAWLS